MRPSDLTTSGRATSPAARPRVAILTNNVVDPDTAEAKIGGAERYGLELARLLADLGLEPVFFQPARSWQRAEFFEFTVLGIERSEAFSEFDHGVATEFYERTSEFDHVIYLMPNLAAGPKHPGSVVVYHGVWWDHSLWPALDFRSERWYEGLRSTIEDADVVVSVDQNLINVLRSSLSNPPQRFRLIPNAVDTHEFRPAAEPSTGRPMTVLVPRRIEVTRGAGVIAEVMAGLPEDIHLHWVGTGDPALESSFDELADRDHRFSWGPANFDEMAEHFRNADICAIPTLASEGQSLSCLEAMASGCAVVTTDVGGLSELVTDGVDALVVEPTATALAAAIECLARDPQLRWKLAANAQRRTRRAGLVQWRHRWAELISELGWVASTDGALQMTVIDLVAADPGSGTSSDLAGVFGHDRPLLAWPIGLTGESESGSSGRLDALRELTSHRELLELPRTHVVVTAEALHPDERAEIDRLPNLTQVVVYWPDRDGKVLDGLTPSQLEAARTADLVVVGSIESLRAMRPVRNDVVYLGGPSQQATFWDALMERIADPGLTTHDPYTAASMVGADSHLTASHGAVASTRVVPSESSDEAIRSLREENASLHQQLEAFRRSRAVRLVRPYLRAREVLSGRLRSRTTDAPTESTEVPSDHPGAIDAPPFEPAGSPPCES